MNERTTTEFSLNVRSKKEEDKEIDREREKVNTFSL